MKIREHTESEVHKKSFDAAMAIFLATKKFPKDETYFLTAGFGARLARFVRIWPAAWRKRRYRNGKSTTNMGNRAMNRGVSVLPNSPCLQVSPSPFLCRIDL